MTPRPLAALGLLSAVLSTLPVRAEDYEIRLHHPQREGAKERWVAEGREFQEMVAWYGGVVMRQQKKEIAVDLDAVATVLALGKKGKVARQAFRIDKLFKTEAGARKELLPSNTVCVAASAGKRTLFEVNGKPVGPEVMQALDLVIEIGGADDENTADEIFGTRERKRVGDSWDINKALAAELFRSDPTIAKDIAGKLTLKEVNTNASSLVIAFDIHGKTEAGPVAPRSDVVYKDGTFAMKWSSEYPINDRPQPTTTTMEAAFSHRGTIRANFDRPEMEVRMTNRHMATVKCTPLE